MSIRYKLDPMNEVMLVYKKGYLLDWPLMICYTSSLELAKVRGCQL